MIRIHPTAIVDPGATLAEDVEIGPYCIVGPHVSLGRGVRLIAHVFLDGWTTIGEGCQIFPFASIGTQTQDLKYKGGKTFVSIGNRTTLREYVTVNSGTNEGETTRVGDDCHIMACAHVAHACQVGNGVIIANAGLLAGHVIVEDQAIIGGATGVHQFVRIGRLCIVGSSSKLTQDAPSFMMVDGNPASVRGINSVGLQRKNIEARSQQLLKKAYKILYLQKLSTRQALEKIRTELPVCPELEQMIRFIETSERGIIK